MPKFDIDLESVCANHKRRLNLDQIIAIGMQMIDRLESLHSLGYVHGDLKPQNIMCSNNKTNNTLYLIDYGLTVNYVG
jgi:serine/threonine protein kinase